MRPMTMLYMAQAAMPFHAPSSVEESTCMCIGNGYKGGKFGIPAASSCRDNWKRLQHVHMLCCYSNKGCVSRRGTSHVNHVQTVCGSGTHLHSNIAIVTHP